MLTIAQAQTPADISTARDLMVEYAKSLEFNLCFQSFDEEMRALPGKYAPPRGRIFLARWDGQAAGVIALRPTDVPGICEMKRLYVRPEFQGKSIGRALANRLIEEAAQAGYSSMCLDTVPGQMDRAIAMYRDLGFKEVSPYYHSPVEQTIYMELALVPAVRPPAA